MIATLPATVLGQLSESLAERTGLHFPEERWCDLERGIAAAAQESGFADAVAYSQQLLSSEWTQGQIESLASHLTIGETYFLRHQASLAVLESSVFPELIASRRNSGRYLRVWCAGCCTGEEPYSIAIMLRRLLPDWREWSLAILGTDINPHFLRKARQGVYREWSFRETDPLFRRAYFRNAQSDSFEILPEIKAMVTFAYLNLASDTYPSWQGGTNATDVIFCRNVLMYFSPERTKHALRSLHASLVPGGWLVLSPSECSYTLHPDFVPVRFPDAILYRRNGEAPLRRPLLREEPWQSNGQESSPIHQCADAQASETVLADESPTDPCDLAHIAANQGKLDEALDWCGKAIEADKLNPRCHFLAGTILQEHGRSDDAIASFQRTLYLDQDFVLAHFSLGNLWQQQGKHRKAARHFGNALRILSGYPPADPLPEAEGMTAGRLAEIIQSMVRTELPS